MSSENELKIYNIYGKIINTIELKSASEYDFCFTLFNNNKIILKAYGNLLLLDLSDGFKTYEKNYLVFNYCLSFSKNNFNLFNKYEYTKLLKTSSNKFLFINEGKAYIADSSSTMPEEKN